MSGQFNPSVLLKLQTWKDFIDTPCVKKGYLWGTGCSGLMVAHKLVLYKGNLPHALSAGFLTFIAVSGLSFVTCAADANRRHALIQEGMNRQGIKHDPNFKSSSH